MTCCAHGVISKKNLLAYISTYDKWNFKPQISSIFHFERVSDVRLDHVLGVKLKIWVERSVSVFVLMIQIIIWKLRILYKASEE